jgi:hypothetical protein
MRFSSASLPIDWLTSHDAPFDSSFRHGGAFSDFEDALDKIAKFIRVAASHE